MFTGRINIVKMAILKFLNEFNTKFQQGFFKENKKIILNFIWRLSMYNSQNKFEKKNSNFH